MSAINQQCPDSARLAAWIDGRLTNAERAEILAHVQACEPCSELVADVLAAARSTARGSARHWQWAAAAVFAIAAIGLLAGYLWLRSVTGEEAYRRALEAALQSDEALWLHPPSTVSTADLPGPGTYRGSEIKSSTCSPDTECGRALAAALHEVEPDLRLRFNPRAARVYLALSALDPEVAWRAEPVIEKHGWKTSSDPTLRVAAWLVLARSGDFTAAEREELRQVVAELDPAHIEDPATLFNLARLSVVAEDFDRACVSWRAYLARGPSGPWADEARRENKACTHR